MYIHKLEELHVGELKLIKKALGEVSIKGVDAAFTATLIVKVDKAIQIAEKSVVK